MAATTSSRPAEWNAHLGLDTEDIIVVPGASSMAASPCSPQSNAMARFEFETGHGSSDGTKILMVEWESDEMDQCSSTWSIDWDGKTSNFPAWDKNSEPGLLRVYILLPPGASIPPVVTITRMADTPKISTAAPATVASVPGVPSMITPVSATEPHKLKPTAPAELVRFTAKPLPAIFAAGLGNKSLEAGKRGVLHTIWAKLRLAVLEAEIDEERRINDESVGLEMAMQEHRWLASHFGLPQMFDADAALMQLSGEKQQQQQQQQQQKQTPSSPSSPKAGGNRLTEKLKGLKLATSPADLATPPSLRSTIMQGRAMSPATTVNVGGAVSLDSILNGMTMPGEADSVEDELFALPMSPRSPEMKRSPFSVLS